MDSFLIKLICSPAQIYMIVVTVLSSSPSTKRPRSSSKQGNGTAAIRTAEFGSNLFYADGGKLLFTDLVSS